MARYDAEASFPFENYADMRKAGILALTVPARYGGLGAAYADYAQYAAEIGSARMEVPWLMRSTADWPSFS